MYHILCTEPEAWMLANIFSAHTWDSEVLGWLTSEYRFLPLCNEFEKLLLDPEKKRCLDLDIEAYLFEQIIRLIPPTFEVGPVQTGRDLLLKLWKLKHSSTEEREEAYRAYHRSSTDKALDEALSSTSAEGGPIPF